MQPLDPFVRFATARVGYPGSDFRLSIERFEIAAGEAVALVGPSGSGKSTMLRAMAGLLQTQGELTVLGERVSSLSDADRRRFRRERLGISLQPFTLLEALDVEENVLLPTLLGGSSKDRETLRENARRLLRELGVERYAKQKPAKLSHGERQRVALCRAIALPRPLVLLDEPTASLDPTWKRAAMALAVSEVREQGGALLVVTHDRDVLDAFDRTVEIGECARVDSPSPAEAS
ncbi:MAG TPA: ATP-binding cassette domain-containing protein [Pirellulaceae bacterium]|nr:ATP-binding cassette domain-containing protein [Pirellulaceae bacterium]